MKTCIPFALFLFATGAVAQQMHVVPAGATDSEGNSATWLPGCGRSGAKQILVGASHLQPLLGRTLTGIAVRRDGTWLPAHGPSEAQLVVRVGAAARSPSDPAVDFADNLPQAAEVFRGTLSIAAMPPITGYAGWVSPHVVEVPFSHPYAYAGGPLAIELEGTLTNGADFYPLDGVEQIIAGTCEDIGVACGPRALDVVRTAFSSGAGLAIGGTSSMHLAGNPGSNALACFGATLLPTPIGLGVLNAPACTWYIDPFVAMPAAILASGIPGFGDLATVRLHLPGSASLLGGQLYVQWLELGSSTLATSQAMRLTIGSAAPTLDMAQLERLSDGSVHIAPACGPVIGFRYL